MKNIWQATTKPIIALAPMAGYTDSAFRVLCLENGADIVYTEMISTEALSRKNEKTLRMLHFLPGEKNVILQLFGTKPESFKKTLDVLQTTNKSAAIVGIDVNFGCPAKKVFKTRAGAALMNNKKLGREIIKAVLENSQLPVSIKIRSQVKKVTAVEFINYIKDLPISAVMIHGRSLSQGFSGKIDFEMIKKVKKLLPDIPVLANGGVRSPQDAQHLLDKTGADGVGIARGALGNPHVFKQIRNEKATSLNWPPIKKTILMHAEFFLKYNDNLIPLRKHLVHYTKGQKNASELRQKLIRVDSLEDLRKL